MLGAQLAGRPILLFEPNASAGVANRWLSRLADEAAVSHPGAGEALHCRRTVTGTPVRPEFFEQPEYSVLEQRGERPLLLVLGGSQGASQLNEMVPAALAQVGAEASRLEVLHQCGPQHVAATEAAYDSIAPELGALAVVPFLDDMAAAMGRASLVISRAGAITLAEICAVGRPAILVPLAMAGAHQADNAAALAQAGAA